MLFVPPEPRVLGNFRLPGAGISSGGQFRYWLGRSWDPALPVLLWIMLNPSDADAEDDDPTIRVIRGFSRRLGFGGLLVGNVYSYISSSPKKMLSFQDPVGPKNDWWLHEMLWTQGIAPGVVCAWGDTGAGGRADSIRRAIVDAGKQPLALALTKAGNPAHPLRKSAALVPKPWGGNP
jgi:hypothetical protein